MSNIQIPHIWVPRCGVMDVETGFDSGKVAGEYTIRVGSSRYKGYRLEIGPFKNLITNIGLERVGTGAPVTEIFVGTGTSTPAVTNTQLQSYLTRIPTTIVSWGNKTFGGAPDYWVQQSATWRAPEGVAAGNLTEVGCGWMEAPASSPPESFAERHRCFSRALIVDSLGNPITVTVQPDEFLDVTYTMRHYPYIGPDVVQTVNLSGVSYTFTSRCIRVSNAEHAVAPIYSMIGAGTSVFYTGTAAGTPPALAPVDANDLLTQGALAQVTGNTRAAYVPGSLTSSYTVSAGLTVANLAFGIRAVRTSPWSTSVNQSFIQQPFQTVISPPIPKDNTKVLSYGYSITYGRY